MTTKKTKRKESDKKKESELFLKPRLVWDQLKAKEKKELNSLCERYKDFLDTCKTEREAIFRIEAIARENGFVPVDKAKKGDKFYIVNRAKNIALICPGENPAIDGFHMVATHVDCPRLDLKQRPLYQELDMSFFKTHYYGGIKKYQWLSRALAIHGRIIKGDGSEIDVVLGETDDEPVFTVLDLLPHLAQKQYQKKVSVAFEAEKLNILIGSLPDEKEEVDSADRVKKAIMKLLNKKYGIIEEDFVSAELEAVPAEKARDVGFDSSLIGSYGQDDRICAYTSLEAILNTDSFPNAAVAMFLDKEEIGSEGNTGAKSNFLEVVTEKMLELEGLEPSQRNLRRAWYNSRTISGDVNGAMDPDYQDVHEKRNAALLGYGVCVTKFTGARGKSSSNDANVEYLGWLRRIFNANGVVWQAAELGKVDEGGGGTLAKYLAEYGLEIIDCGTAILSMHSPFEISSKADVYMTYKAYSTFFKGE